MPNWCENKMTVMGSPKQIEAFDSEFKGYRAKWCCTTPEKRSYHLNALYPVPEDILKIGYSFVKGNAEADELFEKYKMDGYKWCCDHWGIKWDCDIEQVSISEGFAEYGFDSPWTTPYLWALEVSKRWPNLTITLIYYEPGMGFAGSSSYRNGEKIEDEEYNNLEDDYKSFVYEHFGWDVSEDEEAV